MLRCSLRDCPAGTGPLTSPQGQGGGAVWEGQRPHPLALPLQTPSAPTPQRLHPEVEAVPRPCIWAGPRRTPINRAQLEVSCASLGVESAVTVGTGQASLLLEEGQQPRRDVPRSTESPESGRVLQQDWGQG